MGGPFSTRVPCGAREGSATSLKEVPKCVPGRSSVCGGPVWVNSHNIFDAALPFGGYKQSGGGREMVEEAIHEYTETKSVCIRL